MTLNSIWSQLNNFVNYMKISSLESFQIELKGEEEFDMTLSK